MLDIEHKYFSMKVFVLVKISVVLRAVLKCAIPDQMLRKNLHDTQVSQDFFKQKCFGKNFFEKCLSEKNLSNIN